MHKSQQLFRLIMATLALTFSVTACHGGSSGNSSYLPASPSGGVSSDAVKVRVIVSTCGERLHLRLLKVADCKFSEKGYTGRFHLRSLVAKLLGLSPLHGTKDTTFKIQAFLIGLGHVEVKDDKGHRLLLRVRVSL